MWDAIVTSTYCEGVFRSDLPLGPTSVTPTMDSELKYCLLLRLSTYSTSSAPSAVISPCLILILSSFRPYFFLIPFVRYISGFLNASTASRSPIGSSLYRLLRLLLFTIPNPPLLRLEKRKWLRSTGRRLAH